MRMIHGLCLLLGLCATANATDKVISSCAAGAGCERVNARSSQAPLELDLDNPGYIDLGTVLRMTGSVLGNPRTTIAAAPDPKCDDGWALVTLLGSAMPMCARDLRPARRGN